MRAGLAVLPFISRNARFGSFGPNVGPAGGPGKALDVSASGGYHYPLIESFAVSTQRRVELVDITDRVRDVIRKGGAGSGICVVFVPHTTAAVTINENADPDVGADINAVLARLAPAGAGYAHAEGNADAHAKAVLVGSSVTVLVEKAAPVLGTWQGIFFCEFDGPRERNVLVKTIIGQDARASAREV